MGWDRWDGGSDPSLIHLWNLTRLDHWWDDVKLGKNLIEWAFLTFSWHHRVSWGVMGFNALSLCSVSHSAFMPALQLASGPHPLLQMESERGSPCSMTVLSGDDWCSKRGISWMISPDSPKVSWMWYRLRSFSNLPNTNVTGFVGWHIKHPSWGHVFVRVWPDPLPTWTATAYEDGSSMLMWDHDAQMFNTQASRHQAIKGSQENQGLN